MVDIEPYKYQKVTNIKEHNDIVAKINEIVDVINNTNIDTIIPRIAKIETDISGINSTDAVQNADIANLKAKDSEHDSRLETVDTEIDGINSTDALQWQDIESVKGDISTITPKITKLEHDVTDINSTDAVQNADITNLKAKDSEHDSRLGTVDTEIDGITKSLVSDVAILNGTTSGNVKVRIGRVDAPSIDSNDYDIQKPTSVELVQGSAPAMVKVQITLSDGTVLISDDFMFTTEAIGQDVYISSFVFKNGNVAGTISADIGLSNGSTLTANNFAVPTDPNVTSAISDIQGKVSTVENDVSGLKTTVSGHTTSINKLNSEVSNLQTRVTTVEGSVSGLDKLKATVEGHTTSINKLDNDVADLQIDKADANNGNQSIVAGSISATNITKGGVNVATINDIPSVPDISSKADLNNSSQTIVAGTINATNINKNGVAVATTKDIPNISGKVDKAQGASNAGKVLGIDSDGNVTPVAVSSGGEEWEEVNLSNFPTDWVENDRIKVQFDILVNTTAPNNWNTAPSSKLSISSNNGISRTPIIELSLNGGNGGTIEKYPLVGDYVTTSHCKYSLLKQVYAAGAFNNGDLFTIMAGCFNGAGCKSTSIDITTTSNFSCVYKMWRLKK